MQKPVETYLEIEAYFSKLSKKFKSAQEQGFVEIPESISDADEFYKWVNEKDTKQDED